ncbi:MAG: hypothetical protein ACE5IB_02630 [Candidatus Geothermarchaeales archaeon]
MMPLIAEMAQHTVLIPVMVMDWLRSKGFSENDLDHLFFDALKERLQQWSDAGTMVETLDQLSGA